MSAVMQASADQTLAREWGSALFAAHCPRCSATFLVPSNLGAAVCPNCLQARLLPQPALERDVPPELIIPFSVSGASFAANLERWARTIPFAPPSLNSKDLRARMVRVFLPMYLADASVFGAWQSQMGYDYLVASTEERFSGKTWVSQRVNETRTRWEPRAGEIARRYQNLPAPALEAHTASAQSPGGAAGFDTSRAVPFTADALGSAFVRAPEIAPNAAWRYSRAELERRAARDCQTAANAQHTQQFALRATYGDPAWTLLLLPVYVTCYADDGGALLPIQMNGQTGVVTGVKRASMQQARRWSIVLGMLAGLFLLLTLGLGLVAIQSDSAVAPAAFALLLTTIAALAAPVPLLIAWQFNARTPAGTSG